jgi:hypothetical protein
MEVELEGGGGTALSHWDEETFDRELMTGYKTPASMSFPSRSTSWSCWVTTVLERLGRREPRPTAR